MKKLSTFFATLLVSVLLIGSTTFAQTTNWTAGAGSTSWGSALNWDNGVPTSGKDAVINMSLSVQPVLTGSSACKSLSFSGSGSVGLDINTQTLTVSGNINLANGRIYQSGGGTGTIQLTGTWTTGGGTFLPSSGTVQFNGAGAQTIADASTFYNLTVSSGTLTLLAQITIGNVLNIGGALVDNLQTISLIGDQASPLVVGGGGTYTATGTMSYRNGPTATNVLNVPYYNNLEINSSGVVFTASGALSINGNLSIVAGTFNAGSGSYTHTIAGNFTNADIFSAGSGSTVMQFNGIGSQTIAGVTYKGLQISNTSVTVNLSGTSTTTVNGTLTIDPGATLSDNGKQIGSIAVLTNNGTLSLGSGTATIFPTIGTTFTPGAGTVVFAATVPQTVNPSGVNGNYYNLTLSQAGTTFNASSALTIDNNFNIAAGTFVDKGKTISIGGRWDRTGSYTATGTVVFTGSTAVTIPAGETFNNLTITGTSKSAFGTLNVSGILTLSASFSGGGNTINVGGTFNGGNYYTYTSGGTINFNGSGAETIATGTVNNLTITTGTVTASGAVTVAGDFNIAGGTFKTGSFTHTLNGNFTNAGTFTAQTGSTINFTNVAVKTLTSTNPTSFLNVGITSGSKVTLAGTNSITLLAATGAMTVDGTLTTGSYSVQGPGRFALSSTGTLDFANTAGITSAITAPATWTAANYVLDGTNQSTGILPANVATLNFAGTGNTTISSGTTVGTTLTLTSGTVSIVGGAALTIADGATIVDVEGTLNFAPAFAGTVNLSYTGAIARTTGKEMPTTTALVGLTINNAAGITLSPSSNVTVTGLLTFTSGILHSNSKLIITTATGASSSTFIDGKAGITYASGSATSLTFPIGIVSSGTNIYKPVVLGITPGSSTSATYNAQFILGDTSAAFSLPGTLGNVSTNRYYTVTGSNAVPVSAVSILLQYNAGDGVSDNTNLRVALGTNGGSTWINLGGPGSAPNVGNITGTGATTLGVFVLANNFGAGNVLPVELTSFTGASNENNITLKWTTATEVNSFKFAVERSLDKTTWVNVGTVQAAGNSNAPKNYTITDKNVTGGTSFNYRLMMVNPSGVTEDFGKVITVAAAVPTKFDLSQNYPNPFNPSTTIKFSVPKATVVTLKVYNMIGQEVVTLVNEQKEIGFYSLTWNGKNNFNTQVASGVYIYRIVAGDFVSVKKMNLLK